MLCNVMCSKISAQTNSNEAVCVVFGRSSHFCWAALSSCWLISLWRTVWKWQSDTHKVEVERTATAPSALQVATVTQEERARAKQQAADKNVERIRETIGCYWLPAAVRTERWWSIVSSFTHIWCLRQFHKALIHPRLHVMIIVV